MNKNCYQLFESELDKFATSLSVLGSYRQTCSRPVQFGLKKLVAISVRHSTSLVHNALSSMKTPLALLVHEIYVPENSITHSAFSKITKTNEKTYTIPGR